MGAHRPPSSLRTTPHPCHHFPLRSTASVGSQALQWSLWRIRAARVSLVGSRETRVRHPRCSLRSSQAAQARSHGTHTAVLPCELYRVTMVTDLGPLSRNHGPWSSGKRHRLRKRRRGDLRNVGAAHRGSRARKRNRIRKIAFGVHSRGGRTASTSSSQA